MLHDSVTTQSPAAPRRRPRLRHSPSTRRYGRARRPSTPARRLARGARRPVHGRHGAVGLGQVDAHAPARRPRPPDRGQVDVGGARHHHDARQGADQAAPHAHRVRLPEFNLLPTLTAEENILLPLTIAGTKGPARDARHADRARRPRRPPPPPPGRALRRPAAARRRRPGARSPSRRSCSPTSRPATSTPRARSPHLLRDAVDLDGQTTVMVTHDPRAAAAPTASSTWPTGASSPTSPSRPRPTSWPR